MKEMAVQHQRAARAVALDARLSKHTAASLAEAKATTVALNEDKVIISVSCRVKTTKKRDAKQTDPALGTWALAFAKDAYLSGTSCIVLSVTKGSYQWNDMI